MAELFLKPRMAVIPIGPRLNDGKYIDKLRARLDAGEADAGNTVHLERQDQPVPVDRAVLVEIVDDGQARCLPFLQPDERRGHCAVEDRKSTRLKSSH